MKNTYSKFYELFFKKNPNLTVILYSNLSKIVLVFIFSIHIGGYTGWTQNYLWAEKIGGSNSDNVTSIDLDSFKNIYTTGLFAGTVDFDPGPSTFNLSTLNNEVSNPFVSKLDASGNFIWAKQFKAAGAGTGGNSTSIKVDQSNNVYIIGEFTDTVDFDPGVGVFNLTSNGARDIFICKLDEFGNFIWAKSIGAGFDDWGWDAALDASGNFYVTGAFAGIVDFDPNIGQFNLDASSGGSIFVLKISTLGNFVWAKQMGSSGNEASRSIAIDSFDNVYTTGFFSGEGDFNPGVNEFFLDTAVGGRIFISKLNQSGDFIWAKQFGGGFGIGLSISIDAFDNIYTTGNFQGTGDFDPGAGTLELTSVAGQDIFVSKIDAFGNFVWAKQFGGITNYDEGVSITNDTFGNVYYTGGFGQTVDFDPGVGVFSLTSAGESDVIISKLDASGNFVWAQQISGTMSNRGNALVTDNNNIYTVGSFIGTANFDTGSGVFNLTALNGWTDIFIHKISLNTQLNQITTWPDQSWTIEGTYNASNLLANPTTVANNFKFDDAQVAHTGDIIYLESPVINLAPAFSANEKGLKISFNLAFALTPQTTEMIGLQYWDADASLWKDLPEGRANSGESMGDYLLCTTEQVDLYFDFSAFTANQLQNFRYRFFYDDGDLSQGKGICLLAPSLSSVSCNDAPTNLVASNINNSNFIQIGWTANGSETIWQMEYGAAGYTVGSGTKQYTDQNPTGIGGFSPQTSYDAYVRASCVPNNDNSGGELFSPWSSKVNFTTLAAEPSCGEVVGNSVQATISSSNSITIQWFSGNESAWLVEYGKQGYTQGVNQISSLAANSPDAEAVGLDPNTAYDFYIQSDCGNQNFSTWAGPFTFTTSGASIGWANLQWPGAGTINLGADFTVYGQIYINGITESLGQGSGVQAWVGYNSENTNPNTWANWVEASYNTDAGNNDEYKANIGSVIPVDGHYYYATRFQLGQGAYSYGGFSLGGGSFWDGLNYVSGELTINRTASQWSTQTSPLGSITLGKVQFVSATEGWITANNGQLLHTLDAGANWTVVDPTPAETDWIISDPSVAMFWLNPTHGWYISTLGTEISSLGAVLHYTTDGGVNWTNKVIDNTAGVIGVQVQFFDANNGWLATFNANTLIGNGYVSTDGGANWTSNGSDSDGGIMYFLDANNGWKASSVNDAPPHNISYTTDGGSHWTTQYTDITTGGFNAIHFVDANNGWVVGDKEKILKTTDGGATWTPITNTGLPVGGNNFTAVFFSNVNVGRIAAGGDDNRNSSILYTADGGTTWEIQALALPPSVGKSNSNSASKTQIADDTADIFSIYFIDELNGWYVADNGQITHTTGDPLSVQQNNLNAIEGFSFYPNPAQDQLMLKANQKIDQVEVYNLLGQQLMLVKPNVSSYQLKLNTIKSGLYFIKVKTNGKTGTYKVLKQ